MTTAQDILIASDSVELAAADGTKPRRLRIVAYTGGPMSPPGFPNVVIDLVGMTLPTSLPILGDHENRLQSIIASGTPTVENGKLVVVATLANSPAADHAIELLKSGVALQASVGASPVSRRQLRPNESATINGQLVTAGPNGLSIITRSVLKEVSLTPLGADSNTSVAIAARRKELTMTTTATLSDSSDILTAERQRLAEIEASFSGLEFLSGEGMQERASKLKSEAINAGWSLEETQRKLVELERADLRLARLRAERPRGPAIMASSQDVSGPQHLTASLMVKAGFESAAEKCFGANVLEQSRQLHSASLVDLCRAALSIDGREIPHGREAMIRASFSGGSMPVALGDSANKILVEAYKQAPASWRSFAAVKPAANFKTQTGIRPSFAGDLSQLPPDGTIHHGTYSEETYNWSVSTYAKQFQITRVDIINDDASVFSDLIPGLARASARTLNGLVATTILANAGSFFGSGNSNYFEGGATNLQATSLATAIQMLRQMKDAEGNLLDLAPAVLLVPPELEQTGLALLNSTEVSRDASGDLLPTGNTFRDIAKLAVEPRLSDAGYTGNSSTAWYLFSDAMNAAVVVGFLDGMQSPTLETFGLDADINRLAYGFRVYHDFGCALADHRAAIKSKGAA